MSEQFELDGEVYYYIGGEWYDSNFIRVPQSLARRLDALRRSSGGEATDGDEERSRRKKAGSSGGGGDSAFSHADVFPLIANLIHERYKEKGAFVTHRELADGLLQHPEARAQIDAAVKQKGHTPDDWANWMVQWFSAAITEKRSPYQDQFQRERKDGQWAYQPREEA